ncbi:MAG TPA: hypothetical protein VE439_03445 [Anaerolineae bacterium]|nr:hypothetical protein [Anaerolineae bacterium]
MKAVRCWIRGSHRIGEFVIIVVLLGLLGVFGCIGHTSSSKRAPVLADFTEEKLEAFVEDKTGLGVMEVVVSKPKGAVSVSYFDDNIWDEDDALISAVRYSEEIMPILFKLSGVNEVRVIELGTFVNEQDERSIEPSVAITINKTMADRINWDEVDSTNKVGLIYLASDVYVHPEIRAQINYEE